MSSLDFISSFNGHRPRISDRAFVDISARIIGRVLIEQNVSIWPGAVLRGDDEEIRIGRGSAVLDLCLLEAPHGHPVVVAPQALISHQACLHGARVEAGALIGIGAILLDGVVVEEGAIVGAGAVVPPGKTVPAGMLVLGQPAKPVREVKPSERKLVTDQLEDLWAKARAYLREQGQAPISSR